MIKQLGGTRGVPKPSAAVAGEALNLLTFLGGNNKAGAKLLADMKYVQSHNEKLLNEANAAVNEANKLQKGVDQSRATLEKDTEKARLVFDTRSHELDNRSSAIDHKKNVDDAYLKSQNASLGERKASVDQVDKGLVVREKLLEKAHKDVEAREKAVSLAESRASRIRKDLEQRDARLRQAMGG
jgi:hypothetical protein